MVWKLPRGALGPSFSWVLILQVLLTHMRWAPKLLPQTCSQRKECSTLVKVLGRSSWGEPWLTFHRSRLGWLSLATLFVAVVASVLSPTFIFINVTAQVMEMFIIRSISGSQGAHVCSSHAVFSERQLRTCWAPWLETGLLASVSIYFLCSPS